MRESAGSRDDQVPVEAFVQGPDVNRSRCRNDGVLGRPGHRSGEVLVLHPILQDYVGDVTLSESPHVVLDGPGSAYDPVAHRQDATLELGHLGVLHAEWKQIDSEIDDPAAVHVIPDLAEQRLIDEEHVDAPEACRLEAAP